jgi:integrase
MSVAELSDEYLSAKRADLRATTLDKKRRMLEYGILPILGKVKLCDLTPKKLQAWKDSINPKIKTSTKQNYYKELRAMLRFAVFRGYITSSPIARIENFRDTAFASKKDKIRYYTHEEFSRFIGSVREEAEKKNDSISWGLYTFFMIAFWGGLRKGEINALRWSDIENCRIIKVRRSVSQKLKGADVETAPKTASSVRDVEAPQQLVLALREQMERHKALAQWSEKMIVCGGDKCLRDTTIEKANARFAEAAGLRRITIHEFRHSHASLLANAGINIQEVARRLGHSNVQETWDTYAHLYPNEADRAVSALNAMAKTSPEKSPNF